MRNIYSLVFAFLIALPVFSQEKSFEEIFAKSFEVTNEKNRKMKFKGQVLKGKRDGMGSLVEDGRIYVGDFNKDKITGYGMMLAPEGRCVENCDSCVAYVGNWRDGMKSGMGTCYAKNGDVLYRGRFADDVPVDKYPSDSVAYAKYFSTIVLGDGTSFVGEMRGGVPDGFGVMVFAGGDVWQSRFKAGKKNGIGLYSLYDGEWQTMNFDDSENYSVISSSVNYRQIDENRKSVFRSSMSEAFGYFAQAAGVAAGMTATVRDIKSGGVPGAGGVSGYSIGYDSGGVSSVSGKGNSGSKSSAPYSLSENQSKNTDSRTYANYDGMLAKMRAGNMEYNDSERREWQSKMRAIRQKWESRGERFQHSPNEDWLGN